MRLLLHAHASAVPRSHVLLLLACAALRAPPVRPEYCHAWQDPTGSHQRGFRCPEGPGVRDAFVCCGSCALRYCCAAMRSRLDQGECKNHWDTGTGERHTAAEPIYVPFLVVGSTFLAFVLLVSLVTVYCCSCLQPKRPSQPSSLIIQGDGPPLRLAPLGLPAARGPLRSSTSSMSTGSSSTSSLSLRDQVQVFGEFTWSCPSGVSVKT